MGRFEVTFPFGALSQVRRRNGRTPGETRWSLRHSGPSLGGHDCTRTEAGYLRSNMSSLKIGGRPWYWQDLDENQVDAKLQTGGVFASVGLEYFF